MASPATGRRNARKGTGRPVLGGSRDALYPRASVPTHWSAHHAKGEGYRLQVREGPPERGGARILAK